MDFTIYPAIDLRKGAVVRLEHGDPLRQTIFGHDPVATAQAWIAAGAAWLHVVNLDGAFDEVGLDNWQILPKITELGAPVQFGGGVRSLRDVARALNRGAARVILGTAAIEDPDIVEDAVERFGPDRIAIGIDVRENRVKTRGWRTDTAVSAADLGFEMHTAGVETVIHTDISRDGVLTGANIEASVNLARDTGLNVIVSGGVASLDDIKRAYEHAELGISGIIIGRALYDGRINLAEALRIIQ